jgi:hypothetical protein
VLDEASSSSSDSSTVTVVVLVVLAASVVYAAAVTQTLFQHATFKSAVSSLHLTAVAALTPQSKAAGYPHVFPSAEQVFLFVPQLAASTPVVHLKA